MMNTVDLNQPVAEVVAAHPELLDLLVGLGFKPLANPAMRQTVGKLVSIKKGAALQNMDLALIQRQLEVNGYEVIGGDV